MLGSPHLVQTSVLYLTDAVDHEGRNHGRRAADVVRQHTLHTETGQTVVLHVEELCAPTKSPIAANVLAHLSHFDRRGHGIGDARQRAALPALGVRDHPAVPTLERDLAKLDPLSTWDAGLGFDDLR